jgi:hypothetical protein
MLNFIKKMLPEPVSRWLWQLKLTVTHFMSNLLQFLFSKRPGGRRMLGVWDLKNVPWSIGDFLVFIETLSILKIRNNAEKIDICIMVDSDKPGGRRDEASVNPENFRYKLFGLLPVIATLPYPGSVFQFDDREEFWHFLNTNADRYHVFPSIRSQMAETYNFYGSADIAEEQKFYSEYGYIPQLNIGRQFLDWARKLYGERLGGKLPVVLSLRFNPDSDISRNTDPDAWLSFLDRCGVDFPEVCFVVIGARGEAFDGLRNRRNVVVAKDYGSTLSEDFALIRTSLMFMGMDSGVMFIAIYSDLPYMVFGTSDRAAKRMNLSPEGRFNFSTDMQKIYDDPFLLTPESLFQEFSRLYARIDKDEWWKKYSKGRL